MGITDLDEQFTFYAAYHHSTMNKIIHILCVWPILWSALVLSEYLPLEAPAQLNSFVSFIHPLNLTFVVAVAYAAIYIVMDKQAGSLGAILVFACLVTARRFFLTAGVSYGMPAWQIATAVHVACWIAQFVGHGAFEGRSPALFDNLFQAVVMAPLFVLLEVMFFFGYRKDFQRRMWANVAREISKFKAATRSAAKKARQNK